MKKDKDGRKKVADREPLGPPSVKFGPDWETCKEKYKKAGKWEKRILPRLESFLQAKMSNPTQMWNSTDKRASYALSKFYKAHLTHDDSILYTFSQKDNLLRIYGIWSHDELGTGDPPNTARLNKIGTRLSSQVFEQVPKSI